ncbi:GGDEF domain-containing protein [Shewanella intestini]|uniref:diguanylate cyclase n=1 Tax=Shewanella intestini TaxID=2017544 RepID=A0ABS5I5M8_9GAMM|nr:MULTISPECIES: GGDEF domain-containing protein [Shewanella]MBR9729334.1 GGDEF domain-containing protein [Shewanella intestini]MRG37413.1 diguanylate cyclase [Shewanella sp. XMDDZSB0408]
MIYAQFLCLIAGSCAFAWGLLVHPLKIAPKASLRFALANIAIVSGFLLYTLRNNDISYTSWFIADMVMLLGFMLIRWGSQYLFKQQVNTLSDSIVLISAALLMLLVPPQLTYAAYFVFIMSLVSAYIFAMITKDNFMTFRKVMSLPYAALLSIPLSIVSLVFLARAALYVINPDYMMYLTATNSIENPLPMWTYIILLLIVNIVLFGNAITRLVQKIKGLAIRDPLTGLWNRHALRTKMEQVDEQWRLNGDMYSILMIDIDHFRRINNYYGHIAGDTALQHMAQLLTSSLRKMDFICRYGDEEFLIILPSTPENKATIVAEKIQRTVNKSSLLWQAKKLTFSVSIGGTTCQKSSDYQQALKQADEAMFEAKKQGRNNICFWHKALFERDGVNDNHVRVNSTT